jgi:hypothetical protein
MRPWREIAKELTHATSPRQVQMLSQELSRAFENQKASTLQVERNNIRPWQEVAAEGEVEHMSKLSEELDRARQNKRKTV